MHFFSKIFLASAAFLPAVASAFTVTNLINRVVFYIVNPLIAVLFAVTLAVFLWGIARYIWSAEDDASRSDGKKHMIWGLVGMLIIVSVYGIINVATSVLGIIPPR